MERIYRDRLNKLANFLEKLNPKKFNLSIIAKKDKKNPECGTVCCAIGWMPQVFPRTFKWRLFPWSNQLSVVEIEDEEIEDFDAADKYFGLKGQESSYLFMPEYYRYGKRQPKDVAKRIRDFIKTGEFNLKEVPKNEREILTDTYDYAASW